MTIAALLCLSVLAQPLTALPPMEASRGFRLYTGADGSSLWRGYRQPGFPGKGWALADGALSISKNAGGGDLITAAKFRDLDMAFEFRMGEKANSGIMFRVAETDGPTYMTGPEYQLLEDATYGAKATDPHSCGALYDLYPPSPEKTMKPAGEWNSGRIYLRNGLLKHWVNGVKVVEARLYNDDGTPTREWKEKIDGSKFAAWNGFGVLAEGHVAVQDHGDTELSLRSVVMRDPSVRPAGAVGLFNGKDLTGWKPFVPEAGAKGIEPGSVWEVRDGVLVCKGTPVGYIRTENTHTNFILRLQWRFDPAKGAGNSGVLLRMVGEDKVWPKSVEAQLHSGNAGDFWNIDSFVMTTDPARTKGRNTKKTHGAERPLGEWNEYEIVVNKGEVVLYVNGEEVNRATGVEEVPGFICLQSEGAEIHFRDVWLIPLDP
jgi:hypothetical protein